MRTVEQALHTAFVVVRARWSVEKTRQFLRRTTAFYVIVRRDEDNHEWLYLFPRADLLDRLMDKDMPADLDVTTALTLHESGASPVVAPATDVTTIEQSSVVRDAEGMILGFVFPSRTLRDVPPASPPASFQAYPALTAPEQVAFQQSFPITVGFGATSDPSLARGHGQMVFAGVQSTDTCTVLLHGDGVTLDSYECMVPLTLQGRATVTATPTRSSGSASIRADYYFRGVPVGQAERIITIGAPLTEQVAPPGMLQPPDVDGAVDLVVTVRRTADGRLVWTAISTNPDLPRVTNCYSSDAFTMDDARRFAADVILEAEKSAATTFDVLEGFGVQIAALVPPAIWDLQIALAQCHTTPLLVLLKTDEPFIPWELALLPQPLNPAAYQFWATQTCFGRWIDRSTVCCMPTRTQLVTRITAVASRYGDVRSGMSALPNAEKERDMLVATWQATPLQAERKDLETVLVGERSPGHLLHIAAHGENVPEANDQHLILGDGSTLSPRELAPRVIAGQPPRFSLVFLNACQVATAGTSLGQTAGFPGIILASGTQGFLAPLWKVNDGEALRFATYFYDQTLNDENTVGSILQAYRGTYERFGTTTRLAYIWYGHPALRLEFQPQGATP